MELIIKMNKNDNFKRPFAFCVLMFCVYCAMFAPGIYAGTKLSGGAPNTIFQVFVLTTVAGMVYLLGRFPPKWKIDIKYTMIKQTKNG